MGLRISVSKGFGVIWYHEDSNRFECYLKQGILETWETLIELESLHES